MKIKKFNSYINEGVRDLMKPKSQEEIMDAINNLTPYGMLNKLYSMFNETEFPIDDLEEIAEKKIEEAEAELDDILNGDTLSDVVDKVAEWVNKNGGEPKHIIGRGFKELSEHIERYDEIYHDDVITEFKTLLRVFAISEASNNNREFNI